MAASRRWGLAENTAVKASNTISATYPIIAASKAPCRASIEAIKSCRASRRSWDAPWWWPERCHGGRRTRARASARDRTTPWRTSHHPFRAAQHAGRHASQRSTMPSGLLIRPLAAGSSGHPGGWSLLRHCALLGREGTISPARWSPALSGLRAGTLSRTEDRNRGAHSGATATASRSRG